MGTPERFFEAAAACCAELDRLGIFLSPFLAADRRRLGKLPSAAAIASKLSHYRAALQKASAVERAADLLEEVARGTALAA